MREKGSGTHNAIERILSGHSLNIHPRLELGSSEAIKHAVYPAGRQLSVVARAFLDYLLGREDAAPAAKGNTKLAAPAAVR